VLRGSHTLASVRRVLASRATAGGTCLTAAVQANRVTTVRLARPFGPQTLAVRIVAEANASRATTAVRALR
jgi:hypothetical protein